MARSLLLAIMGKEYAHRPWISWNELCNNCFFLWAWKILINGIIFLKQSIMRLLHIPNKTFVYLHSEVENFLLKSFSLRILLVLSFDLEESFVAVIIKENPNTFHRQKSKEPLLGEWLSTSHYTVVVLSWKRWVNRCDSCKLLVTPAVRQEVPPNAMVAGLLCGLG